MIDIRYDVLLNKETENTLAGYSYFVNVSENLKSEGVSPYQAHVAAMEECLKKGYLTEYLRLSVQGS